MSATTRPALQPGSSRVKKTTITRETQPEIEVERRPGAHPDPVKDFWGYIASLAEEDWKDHYVTLYRHPLGQPKPRELGRYVKTYKYRCPLLGEEQVAEEFGGGQFDAILKGKRDGKQTMLKRESWDIEGPMKNPWATSHPTAAAPAPSGSDTAAVLHAVLSNLQQLHASMSPAKTSSTLQESIRAIQALSQAVPREGIKDLAAALASMRTITGRDGIIQTIALLKELGVIGEQKRNYVGELRELLKVAQLMR